MKDLNAPYDWFKKGQPEDHVMVRKVGLEPGYKTVILDSVTDLQRIIIDEVTDRADTGPGDPVGALGRQGFGQLLGRSLHLTRLFFDLPVHVLMTTLETIQDGRAVPLLWGQASDEVPGYAYAVGRLTHYDDLPVKMRTAFKGNVESAASPYISLWSKTSKYYAKDQYGAFGNYMFDTTLTKMLDMVYEPGGE